MFTTADFRLCPALSQCNDDASEQENQDTTEEERILYSRSCRLNDSFSKPVLRLNVTQVEFKDLGATDTHSAPWFWRPALQLKTLHATCLFHQTVRSPLTGYNRST